ncbi:MAG TPA: Uma2 family endonuclease [Thermoanaerobaculia bacterium]|jgi:Uma2 family endonuclease|nr:Uma2 family endonuclease [Thermoanaerobaculia bacterium]
MANRHDDPEKGPGWEDASLRSEIEALNDERIALLIRHLDGDLSIEDQQRLDALTDRIFEIAPPVTLEDWEAARPIEQRLSQTNAFIGMIKRGRDDADNGRTISHEEMKARISSWAATKDPVAPTVSVDGRLTREEYERLVEEGYFHPDARIELVEGILCEMPRQTSFHATGIQLSDEALRSVFSEGYVVWPQCPVTLGSDSEPQPDIAVVPGHFLDYLYAHPSTAILIIEVADSSLLHDQERKARLYAREAIPEYWIVNLVDWCLEVYREPKDGVYTSHTVLRAGDSVSPLSRPEASIPIASLLPRK